MFEIGFDEQKQFNVEFDDDNEFETGFDETMILSVGGAAINVDPTLKNAGEAADAKVVGDKLAKKTEKTRIDFDGQNFKLNGEKLDYKQLYDIHITNPDFAFVVYGDRAYLLSYIQDSTSAMRELRFESSIATQTAVKTSGIYVTSTNGIDIAGVSVRDINSENQGNKVSEITEANKNSTVNYPSNAAIAKVAENLVNKLEYAPVEKTAAMTQPVGKDVNGKLWTAPGSGGGVSDVTVNGSSVVEDGVAKVPLAIEVEPVPIPALYHSQPAILPELFGAKGDGVTDDTDAMQRAIASANASHSCIILTKQYKVASLDINKAVTMLGSFPVWTNVVSNMAPLPNIVSDGVITVSASCTFIGVGFTASKIAVTAARCHFDKCVFYQCGTALSLYNNTTWWHGEVTVKDCCFAECNYGIVNEESETGMRVMDTEIKDNTVIHGGTFISGRIAGWQITGNHIYCELPLDITAKDVIISGNYFDCKGTALQLNATGEVNITGNMFYHGAYPEAWDGESKVYTCIFSKTSGAASDVSVIFTGNTLNLSKTAQPWRVFVKCNSAMYVKMTGQRLSSGATLFEANTIYNGRYIDVDSWQHNSLRYGTQSFVVTYIHNTAQFNCKLNYDKTIAKNDRVFDPPYGNDGNYLICAFSYNDSAGTAKNAAVTLHFYNGVFDILDVPSDYAADGKIYVVGNINFMYNNNSV